MSRMMVAPPITSPEEFCRHEILTETSTTVPSFRDRSVSRGSTLNPCRAWSNRAYVSSSRGGGTRTVTGWPMTSSGL
jgi:hypothetical protein